MSAYDSQNLAKALSKLKRSVENWRSGTKTSRAIPEEIWEQAVAAADKHGLGAVVKHVGLDHTRLKRKLTNKRSKGVAMAPVAKSQEMPLAFFELLPTPEPPRDSERYRIEVESDGGGRLRLEVTSLELPGLVNLVRGFAN